MRRRTHEQVWIGKAICQKARETMWAEKDAAARTHDDFAHRHGFKVTDAELDANDDAYRAELDAIETRYRNTIDNIDRDQGWAS